MRVVRTLTLGLLAAGNVEKLRRTPIYSFAEKRKEKQGALRGESLLKFCSLIEILIVHACYI